MPLKENEILDQVEAYLAGDLPLRELSAWLHEAAWDLDDAAPRTQAFAYAVLGRLAEHSSSNTTSNTTGTALRDELRVLARARREALDRFARVIVRRMAPVPVETESSTQILEERFPVAP